MGRPTSAAYKTRNWPTYNEVLKRRVWRKIHIGIDEKSLEIRPAAFTTSDIGDAPILPELRDQIPPIQEIATVTATAHGAAAIIQPCKNPKPWNPAPPGP